MAWLSWHPTSLRRTWPCGVHKWRRGCSPLIRCCRPNTLRHCPTGAGTRRTTLRAHDAQGEADAVGHAFAALYCRCSASPGYARAAGPSILETREQLDPNRLLVMKDIAEETYVVVPDACGLARATRALFRSHRRNLCKYSGEAMSYQVLKQWAGLGIGATGEIGVRGGVAASCIRPRACTRLRQAPQGGGADNRSRPGRHPGAEPSADAAKPHTAPCLQKITQRPPPPYWAANEITYVFERSHRGNPLGVG